MPVSRCCTPWIRVNDDYVERRNVRGRGGRPHVRGYRKKSDLLVSLYPVFGSRIRCMEIFG